MSASDISSEAFVGVTTLACGGYLKALCSRRLVHISGWRKTRKGFVTPLFSLGDRADVARPKFENSDRNSSGMDRIVEALERFGMLTYLEAAKSSGLSSNTVKNARYMDILVKQNRIYIAAWRRNRAGPMIAVYVAGSGKSVEKPAPLSQAEKCRRSRERKKFADDRGIWAQFWA